MSWLLAGKTPPSSSSANAQFQSKRDVGRTRKEVNYSGLVRSMQTLCHDWSEECSTIQELLSSFASLARLYRSVFRSSFRPSFWKENLWDVYPDAMDRIQARIFADLEAVCSQLRTFLKRLGDLHLSLQAKTNEAIAAISNEPIAEDSALGDIDLVLWIQEIRRTLCLDFRAREGIVRAVLTLWEIEEKTGGDWEEKISEQLRAWQGLASPSNEAAELLQFRG